MSKKSFVIFTIWVLFLSCDVLKHKNAPIRKFTEEIDLNIKVNSDSVKYLEERIDGIKSLVIRKVNADNFEDVYVMKNVVKIFVNNDKCYAVFNDGSSDDNKGKLIFFDASNSKAYVIGMITTDLFITPDFQYLLRRKQDDEDSKSSIYLWELLKLPIFEVVADYDFGNQGLKYIRSELIDYSVEYNDILKTIDLDFFVRDYKSLQVYRLELDGYSKKLVEELSDPTVYLPEDTLVVEANTNSMGYTRRFGDYVKILWNHDRDFSLKVMLRIKDSNEFVEKYAFNNCYLYFIDEKNAKLIVFGNGRKTGSYDYSNIYVVNLLSMEINMIGEGFPDAITDKDFEYLAYKSKEQFDEISDQNLSSVSVYDLVNGCEKQEFDLNVSISEKRILKNLEFVDFKYPIIRFLLTLDNSDQYLLTYNLSRKEVRKQQVNQYPKPMIQLPSEK